MSSSNLQAALDEAGKVAKRQKTCADKSDAALDRLVEVVGAAKARLEAGRGGGGTMGDDTDDDDGDAVMAELQRSLDDAAIFKDLNSNTKELHSAIGKLGKVGAD